jgi:hypothetical protein
MPRSRSQPRPVKDRESRKEKHKMRTRNTTCSYQFSLLGAPWETRERLRACILVNF